jgi:hypothetical protein
MCHGAMTGMEGCCRAIPEAARPLPDRIDAWAGRFWPAVRGRTAPLAARAMHSLVRKYPHLVLNGGKGRADLVLHDPAAVRAREERKTRG